MNYCLIGESWLTEYFMREWYDYLPEEQLYCPREFTIYRDTKIRGDEWEYHDILLFDNFLQDILMMMYLANIHLHQDILLDLIHHLQNTTLYS